MKIHNKVIYQLLLVMLGITIFCAGCSDEPDKPGKIEKFTDQTAQKAVEHIRTPIDKARQVEELMNAHSENMAKSVEQMK